jgi:aminopeptidase
VCYLHDISVLNGTIKFMSEKTFEQKLADYADLAVRVGVNIQPGQRLVIRAPIESAPFVRLIAKAAYKAGSPLVSAMYIDDALTLTRFENAPAGSFATYPEWEASSLVECAKRGDAFIRVSATDPDLLKDQNSEDVSTATKSAQEHLSEYMKYPMADKIPWLVISMPIPSWSQKVYPGLPKDEAVSKMWDTIFKVCRADLPNPVEAWQKHLASLAEWSKYLNEKAYDALHYRGEGTDLKLGLPKGHIWKSGASTAASGVDFVANIPTEEVFTMGDRNRAEGTLRSSKPLNYAGTVIDGFEMEFKGGKVVKIQAEKGQETLQKLIDTDEGSKRLGEIALVPHRSPISESGLLFYNTLFDENAASHLALGRAYRFSLEGGKTMSDEDFQDRGGNNSLVHVDFMIGNETMDVDGITTDGKSEPLMRGGAWAFQK